MNPTTPKAPALKNLFPPKPPLSPTPKTESSKKRWFGYVTSRGNLRIKVFVDKSEHGRQATADWLTWADTYVWAKTDPFTAHDKQDALLQAKKLLAVKLNDFGKQHSTKTKPQK